MLIDKRIPGISDNVNPISFLRQFGIYCVAKLSFSTAQQVNWISGGVTWPVSIFSSFFRY